MRFSADMESLTRWDQVGSDGSGRRVRLIGEFLIDLGSCRCVLRLHLVSRLARDLTPKSAVEEDNPSLPQRLLSGIASSWLEI